MRYAHVTPTAFAQGYSKLAFPVPTEKVKIVEVKSLGSALCFIALASCGGTTRVGNCPRTAVANAAQVSSNEIEARRIAGERNIQPSKYDARAIAASHRRALGIVKVCLDEHGIPACLDLYRSTGYRDYDDRILRTMKSWRYTPYRRDGRAIPVCTAVSFIYYPVVRYRP